MPYPERSRIEAALLQELKVLGEAEPRVLYGQLARYFPQLQPEDLRARTRGGRNKWWSRVQRAKQSLMARGEVEAVDGRWRITEKGRERAQEEGIPIQLVLPVFRQERALSHEEVKRLVAEVGQMLGKYAEVECQRYDVVWRDSPLSPRISHAFEVQVRGKLESALTKLKHAYDTQRSLPVLVVTEERDSRRAREMLAPYLAGSFHEIGAITLVLSAEEVMRLHRVLSSVRDLLERLLPSL